MLENPTADDISSGLVEWARIPPVEARRMSIDAYAMEGIRLRRETPSI
jgi:hypothetical protein